MLNCKEQKAKMLEETWWKETVFYEIYMPSYKDSNCDGFGDFKGITSKLDYIESLGIKGIWLTPFLKSPKVDNGYDVSSYFEVDPIYGTLEDFKYFIKQAHKRDIKIIMDLVVNHTSTDHIWFQESKKSKDNPYRDYYVWQDDPNNWESFFGGTAWELDRTTNQYYYHQFDVKMADLNWNNPKVIEEIKNVLRFWLKLGVDGYRLDVINFLTTDGITSNNPINEEGNQEHLFDINQNGVKNAIKMIRKTVNEYDNRFIVGEIGSDQIEVLKQFQESELLDVVFNFNFGSIKEFSAKRIFEELESMEKNLSNYPTLFFGSHDMPRLVDRLAKNNPKRAEALAALILTAKGIPFIYYGEEIGMKNITAESIHEMKDVQGRTHYHMALANGKSEKEALIIANNHNRDKSRSPMQWDATEFSGFSKSTPWIKLHRNHPEINVYNLEIDKKSILNKYKKLIALRNSEPVFQYGSYKKLSLSKDMIHFTRVFNQDSIQCYFNFSETSKKITLKKKQHILMGNLTIQPNDYLIIK